MRRLPSAWLVAFAVGAMTVAAAGRAYAQDSPSARVVLLEHWLTALLNHAPGKSDGALDEARAWWTKDVQSLQTDEGVLVELMRDPARSTFFVNVVPPGQRSARRTAIPYSGSDLHRLKVLACVASGTALSSPLCQALGASSEIDEDLRRLNEAVRQSTARGDPNLVLRRGALLHTDAELAGPDTTEPGRGSGPVRIIDHDGRATGMAADPPHWKAARALLDAVQPAPDAMVRLWYRATSEWMQGKRRHLASHIDHAVQLFPADPHLLFLSGCQHEIYASPEIQVMVQSIALRGVTLEARDLRSELSDAEADFTRAIASDPRFGEARVHLAHVLLLRGKPEEAANELRLARDSLDVPELIYFDEMFLGSAEEALKHWPAARDAYARAQVLFPRSQSALMAMSALAMRNGDRDAGIAAADQMFDASGDPSPDRDPWWSYYTSQARDAQALLAAVDAPFRTAP